MMRYLRVFMVFACVLLFAKSVCCAVLEHPQVLAPDNMDNEVVIGDYNIRTYSTYVYYEDDVDVGALLILKNGKIVLANEGYRYYIGQSGGGKDSDFIRNGQDLTGDGIPNIVVYHWSGGWHCCNTVYIFSLGDELELIDTLDLMDSEFHFEDIDSDGVWEIVARDYTFAYWNASFVISPAPRIILRYDGAHYRLALDLMAKPLPPPAEEKKAVRISEAMCADGIRAWRMRGWCVTVPFRGDVYCFQSIVPEGMGDTCVAAPFWRYMLRLIYEGHPQEAWRFLDRYWNGGGAKKRLFVRDFKEQLIKSPYAEQLPVDFTGIRREEEPAGEEPMTSPLAQAYSFFATGRANNSLTRERVKSFLSTYFLEAAPEEQCQSSH